jgi:hypothetical protein
MLRFRTRYLRFLTSLLAAAILVAPSADAQRKKPKKKPAATAKPKAGTKAAPPAAAAKEPPAAEPAAPAPEPEPEPEPMPKKKPKAEKAEEAEAPAPDSNPEEDKGVSAAKDKDKSTKMGPLLDAEIGLKGFQRHLAYQGDANNVLPNYDLSGAPAIAIDVGVYPIRTSSGGFTFGITGSFENAFSIATQYKAPVQGSGQEGDHATSANAYAIGARGNFNFGSNTIGIGVEYGAQNYKLDLPPPDATNAQVPDVAYRFIRPSVNGRFGLSNSFAIVASFGYLYMLSAGEIVSDAYFRGAITTASGIDLNAGVAWAPLASMRAFEIRPMLGWRRVSFSFNTDPANPNDPYIATGAHDDYLSLALMFGVRL